MSREPLTFGEQLDLDDVLAAGFEESVYWELREMQHRIAPMGIGVPSISALLNVLQPPFPETRESRYEDAERRFVERHKHGA